MADAAAHDAFRESRANSRLLRGAWNAAYLAWDQAGQPEDGRAAVDTAWAAAETATQETVAVAASLKD